MPTILCPIDFSESSEAALELAVAAAYALGLDLHLFHVDPPPTLAGELLKTKAFSPLKKQHDEWLETRIASARLRLRSNGRVDAVSRIARGDPASEIVEEAGRVGAELIVMSTHSSPVRRAVLGSVASAVARAAQCPVLLVRDHSNARVPFERPLVCIDFSALSRTVCAQALAVSSSDADIELLHVVDEPGVAALQVSLGRRAELLKLLDTLHRDAKFRLEEFAAKLPLERKAPRQTVVGGPIAATILRHANETKASLLVVGSHEPAGIRERLLGTVADRVLHHAEIPVLLCPQATN